jgi:hypothetical protein
MVRFLFTLCYSVLLFRFFFAMFDPGPGMLHPFFTAISPIMPLVTDFTNWLMLPVNHVIGSIQPWFPPSVLQWFPAPPAANIASLVINLLTAIPGIHDSGFAKMVQAQKSEVFFPGIVEWAALITCYLLGWLEKLLDVLLTPAKFALSRRTPAFLKPQPRSGV